MSNPDATLVLGAGQLGLAMLRGLAPHAAPGTLAVLLRPASQHPTDPQKQRDLAALRALGVQVVAADLVTQSTSELAAVFGRFATVVSCTGFVGGRGVQRKIARAALDGGVRRFVPWQFGVDYDRIGRGSPQDLFDEQLDVRDMLRAQAATEWLVVSTGMFTSFLFEPAFGVVDLAARRVNALGGWDTQVTVTTAEDIGALTAAILRAEPRIANQAVYVAGDTVSYGQLADTVERALGIAVRRESWTAPALMRELAAAPDDAMRKYRAVFAQGRGVAWDPARTFNAAHGIAAQGLDAWVREHLPALRRAAGVST